MRLRLWQNAMETVDAKIAGAELEALADRFVLTPAQISAATQSAFDSGYLSDRESSAALDAAALFDAAARSIGSEPGQSAQPK